MPRRAKVFNRSLEISENSFVVRPLGHSLPPNRYHMKIGIVGLGYVGLPLCLQFARNGAQVVGLDIDAKKVEAIKSGRSYIEHISSDAIKELVGTGRLTASTDFTEVKKVEAVIICVPTPLNKNREPDISYII